MKASAFEFRFRFLIHGLIYMIGFLAPWNMALHLDTIRTWQLLAAMVSRTGWVGFSAATILFLTLGIVIALAAALLRTWASAYLGASVVFDGSLLGQQVVAAGPYRYVRNPLYLGTFLHTLALSLLMPSSGAVVCVVLIGLFQLRLIAAEEPFLLQRFGESYRGYCAKVPRLLPALPPRVPESTVQPHWRWAFAGESYMWGVVLSFAILGWRYNSQLVLQGVIVSLGVSIVLRAFLPKEEPVVRG
jgi:protein-S-isoprenylcysteine O-methyltransferase Ste14